MSENRPRNWLKISCIGCVGLPCLSLMLGVGIVKCQVEKIGDQLPIELAKLKAMGVGTEPADLKPNPPIPDGENAATLYKKIFEASKKISSQSKSTDGFLLANYTGHPTDTAAYETALARYKPVFDLAAGLPKYRKYSPDRKYKDGFDLLFPEFADMKDLVKKEGARIRYLLQKGRRAEAVSALEVQFSVADHLAQEQTLIGALVCIAIHAIASVNLDVVLEDIQDNETLLARVEDMLNRHGRIPGFRHVMEGEAILGRVSLGKIKSAEDAQSVLYAGTKPTNWEQLVDRVTLGDPSFRRMFEAKHVEAYRRLFQMLPKDERNWVAMDNAMKKFAQGLEADSSIGNRMNQILFPVFDQAAAAFGKMQAEHQVALLAVKLLRARPRGLPQDLTRFGKLATDPFTGMPMGYIRRGDGFKVWSVGGDLHDDGGRKRGPGMSYNDADIVFGYRIGLPFTPPKPLGVPPGSPGAAPGVLGR